MQTIIDCSTSKSLLVIVDVNQSFTRMREISDQQRTYSLILDQWLKWFCEAEGAHLTKPGWSKPHTPSNSTNLALFRHKITLYRFNQGLILLQGCSNGSRGLSPPSPLTLTTVLDSVRCRLATTDRASEFSIRVT